MTTNRAHDKDPGALLWTPVTWNRPTLARPFRTCSFCGSIHPEDLMAAIADGETIMLADEKHGWPHKLYTSEYVKFYTAHLLDAGEVFDALAAEISKLGIEFTRVEQDLAYRRLKGVK